MNVVRSRGLAVAAMGVVAALGLVGCAGDAAPADPDAPVTIRFAWWGGELRNTMTQDVIDAFEDENPNITVEPEISPFEGFFDKLATQVAAGDAPDVIQMPDSFFSEYVGRGALLDISDLPVDHSAIADTLWSTGEVDGAVYGAPSGANTSAMVANVDLFEQAGIPLPDDSTWTWDDYAEISQELSEKLPDGSYGTQIPGTDQNTLGLWLRQNGSQLFEDGQLGFEADDAASFFQFVKDMQESGAAPTAEEATEQMGLDLAQSGTATNRYAIGFWASNQLKNLVDASGQNLQLLKFPTVAGDAEEGQFVVSTGWYSIFAKSEHPEAAAKFIDFMINSEVAGGITLTERGVPANTEVAESISDSLDGPDLESMEFLEDVRDVALNPPPAAPPTGAGAFQEALRRMVQEVMFDRLTPEQAAQQIIDEISPQIR